MSERIFIPVRRRQDVLIYEYFEMPTQRRWQFRVVAARIGEEGVVQRTGIGGLSEEELAACADLAARLPHVEEALRDVRLTNVETFTPVLGAPADAAVVTGSMLFTSTLYINLMRQHLVEESSISRYEARSPEDRFDIGLTASIYDGLIKRYDLERASKLLDEDLPHANPPKRQHREWAYFHKVAADIRLRNGHLREGIALLEQAAQCQPEANTYRRIASTWVELDDKISAISAYEKAHAIEPLAAQPRLRLAWCYFQTGNREQAAKFAEKALAMGNARAQKLLDRLEDAQKG